MNHEDFRTLRLLEEIGRSEYPPTQRDLAKKLDVSLGLVNAFVKRLVQKGYFKVSTISKSRMRYVLTAKGITEKTRLTYKYMQHSYQFYKDARQKFCDLFRQLTQDGISKVVFYGAGDVAEIAGICLEETLLNLVAVVDDARVGEHLSGVEVKNTNELASIGFDKILVTTAQPHTQILKDIKKLGIGPEQVVVLQ